ncbi:hypothetical protein F511_34796 [Dorcoceras hygrometricum]|uniref:Uncharacterized protein n=1 Tax=Dorcoceras hygrometricum TaxID=472368 RepID=A0A2Z7CKW9_9LAMI|nr:hypothetical protein F511_34796 [Dorcoceras hygrometricum]
MRSVVASHGPGSNPRGNAICNAILLQSFPVIQIFGLQYLDRHRPPSSDVLPLNLAQKLKISKSTKTGLISHIGPKTSRAARDRPDPNPRRNQTSRHDISGDSPERRPAGGAATTRKTRGGGRATSRRARVLRAACIASTSVALHAQHIAHSIGDRAPSDAALLRTPAASHAAASGQQARDLARTCVTLNGSGIQLAVGPQPLWLRNHNSGPAQRIMVKRLATSPHDPLGITDSACKNQLVVVSVQYGPFNPYIPIRSTTIDSIGYPRMSASGESSTTMHRLLHASGSHPIPTPYDPKTNQYNQDLGLIHSTNGNHLESPNEGSSIDHQVTIYLHAQNITMFPTNETWYFASQILVSNSGGLILILTAQLTKNMFRIHNDY